MTFQLPELSLPFLLAAGFAVLLMGISKAGFGGGLGALATPLMTLVMPATTAVAVLLPLLLAMDALGIWTFRKKFDKRILKIIIPGAVIGMLMGWLFFGLVDPRYVKAVLGIECVLFALLRLRKGAQLASIPAKKPTIVPGVIFGALSSFASFISHAGSPPILQYILPLKLEKTLLVGTMTVFFTFVNVIKLVPYGVLGLLNTANLGTSLVLLPIVPMGYWLGIKALHGISDFYFQKILTWALFFTGLKLLWDAFR